MHHTGTGQRKWRGDLHSRAVKPLQGAVIVRQIAFAILLFALPACRSNPDLAIEPRAAPLFRPSLAPVLRPLSLSFENLNPAAGLSQSGIYSIAQDAQGFLWIATEDGLNRYDGYSFKVFRPQLNDSTSLTDGFVQTLLVDSTDQLWIGTNRGLDRYDAANEAFFHIDGSTRLSTADVLSLYETEEGYLWVGTNGDGLFRLDLESGDVERVPVSSNALNLNVQAMVEDDQGVLWVGADTGLYRLDASGNRLAAISEGDIQALCLDEDGQLWIGSAEEVVVSNPHADRISAQQVLKHDPANPASLTTGAVRTLFADRSGTMWIGTTGGLNRVDADGQRIVRYEHDPADATTIGVPYVRSIFEDREGNLWVGTYGGGLARAAPNTKQFRHLLDGYGVTGMAEAPPGTLWAGTLDDGLFRIDLNSNQVEHFTHNPDDPDSLISNHIWDVAIDQQSTVWVGTIGGLSRLDPPYASFTHYRHDLDNDQSLSHDHVWTLLSDRSGALWIGTEAGLDRINGATETFTRYQSREGDPTGLSSHTITALYESADGNLWVGTFNSGLDRLDPVSNQFSHYAPDPTDPNALSHPAVVFVGEDSGGNLWVGTYGGGLNRFDPQTERFTQFGTADGLPNDVVYSLLDDSQGGFWLSTNRGLSHFDPQAVTFDNFTANDGLQSNEFNLNAALIASTGELYFGGINGLTVFDSQVVERNSFVPPVVLTSVTQGGDSAELDAAAPRAATLTLNWPQNFFEFEFAALSYAQPEANQYAYKLDGFEEEWNENGTRRFGRYTNLPGGTYTLRIRGSNGDGVWNESGVALTVVVVPPLWLRPWAQVIFMITLIATVATAYGLRARTVELRSQALEAEVAARTRDLEGLNAIGTVVSQTLDLQETLDAALAKSAEVLQCDAGGIFLLPPGQSSPPHHLSLAAHYGLSAQLARHIDNLLVGEGFSGQVVQTGQPLVSNTLVSDSRLTRRELVAAGYQALAVTPLLVRKRVIGTLFMLTQQPRQFLERDRSLLAAIGGQVGVAIENARLFEQAQDGAILAERQRIARDLHDAVSQSLYGVTLHSRAAAGQLARGRSAAAATHLAAVQDAAQEALAEMRLLIHELRPPVLAEEGLSAALQMRLRAVESRAGVQISFREEHSAESEPQRLPTTIEQGLYRIGQEALNNALKHARADRIAVRLRFAPHQIALEIEDNGMGFSPEAAADSGGVGLTGMAQRATEMDGILNIDSAEDRGTRICVEVPL